MLINMHTLKHHVGRRTSSKRKANIAKMRPAIQVLAARNSSKKINDK